MAEEIKQKIRKFLRENPKEEFSISKIREKLGHAYPSILKWVEVLSASPEEKITVRDFGNIKLVSFTGECKTE